MAQGIDALQIEISARADSANRAINRLTRNLDRLSTSLNSLNITNMGGLATVATQTNAVATNSTRMDNALRRTNATMRSTSKQAWSLARAFGKFYANYFLIIRGAKALGGAIKSTADYIEAYNYFNVAFGKVASEWSQDWEKYGYDNAETYAESFTNRMNETLGKLSGIQIDSKSGLLTDSGMKNLGLNIQEITQYASQLASVTNAVGQTGETSLAVAKTMTMLAGDVSSLFNVDFSNVATNIQAVLQGQSRAGYKYGWDTTLATLQKYADELNLSKAVSEMTQLEKQQLRIIAVLDQSKVSWGDLANTINSPSNMIRQLTTNLKETGMVLGQLFIPMLENVLPVVNGTTIAIKRLLTEIAGFFGVEIDFEKFGQGYNQLEDETGDLADSYDDLASSIEEVKSQLLGFDEVNKLSDTSATLSVGTEDNTIDLTDEIVSATEEYQKVWDEAFANMENTSQKWADRVQKALDGVGTVFEDFAVGDFFKAGEDVSQLAIDFNNFIAKAIEDVDWEGLGEDVGLFLKGIKWLEVFKSLADVISNALEGAAEFWFASFKESPIETLLLTAVAATRLNVVQTAIQNKIGGTVFSVVGKIALTLAVADFSFNLGQEIAAELTGQEWLEDLSFTEMVSRLLSSSKQDFANAWDQFIKDFQGEITLPDISVIDGLDMAIGNIESRFTSYEQIASDYLKLSQDYENLSEADKSLIKEYSDILAEEIPGIKQWIDQTTGAWKGTNEQLENAIANTKKYYMTNAYETMKSNLYADMAKSEIELAKYSEKRDKARAKILSQLEKVYGKKWMEERNAYDTTDEELAYAYSRYMGYRFDSTAYNEFEDAYKHVEAYEEQLSAARDELHLIDRVMADNLYTVEEQKEKVNQLVDTFKHLFGIDTSKKVNVDAKEGLNILDTVKSKVDSIPDAKLSMDTSGFLSAVNSAFSTYAQKLGTLVSVIKLKTDEESLSGLLGHIKKSFANTEIKVGNSVGASLGLGIGLTGFATGGHPDMSAPFIVGEKGPEIMGGMFGKPTVANSNSITDGIRQAAYEGMKMALAESEGNRQNVNVTLQGDAKRIFNVVRTETNNFVAQTGQSPYNI